jgi:uncharacterized protein (TIGR03435 family)
MFEPGGRVTATCMPLRSLVTQAWGLANFEQPAEWPKWLDERHNMSVEAKAPAGMTPDPQINAQARDILNAMLRALLTERYRMKVHFEDRPRDAGALVANKPKLTKASDPASRTGCKRESQQSQGRSLLVRVVCRNMTMTQFAEQLPAFDSDLFYPVQDRTGLEGAWDFVLNYDAMAGLNARMPSVFGGTAAAGAQGSEPSGIPSFREAIDRQLGLKLEIEKRPEPVLVIDSMEETPIPN